MAWIRRLSITLTFLYLAVCEWVCVCVIFTKLFKIHKVPSLSPHAPFRPNSITMVVWVCYILSEQLCCSAVVVTFDRVYTFIAHALISRTMLLCVPLSSDEVVRIHLPFPKMEAERAAGGGGSYERHETNVARCSSLGLSFSFQT